MTGKQENAVRGFFAFYDWDFEEVDLPMQAAEQSQRERETPPAADNHNQGQGPTTNIWNADPADLESQDDEEPSDTTIAEWDKPGQCELCFCLPCVTQAAKNQSWLGAGQTPRLMTETPDSEKLATKGFGSC
jgi:hypothetical protein